MESIADGVPGRLRRMKGKAQSRWSFDLCKEVPKKRAKNLVPGRIFRSSLP